MADNRVLLASFLRFSGCAAITAAAFCVAGSEPLAGDDTCSPAVAAAFPRCQSINTVDAIDNNEHSEPLAINVNHSAGMTMGADERAFWKFKRLAGSPTCLQPVTNAMLTQAEFHAPFRNSLSLSTEKKNPIYDFVVRLFSFCCPSDVPWLIASPLIRVSVECVMWRRRIAHVVQEIGKRLNPAFTNRDATAPIELVGRISWIAAAAFHGNPAAIGPRLSLPVFARVSMRREYIAMKAPTASVPSGPEITSAGDNFPATVTQTNPSRLTASVTSSRLDNEP